jgi:nucleoside-diphosphate-sugar epimerase
MEILNNSLSIVIPKVNLKDLNKKRIFITGGTGFFGIWLLSALRMLNEQGISVEVCVLSRNPNNFLSRYPQFIGASWLSFVEGNVRDFQIPEKEFDYLLHAATETSSSAHANPEMIFDDIVLGTRQVLHLAQKCGVSRILLISSGAVYGPQPPGMTHQPDESMLACNPLLPASAYGEGKRAMELMGAMLQDRTGIESVVARCFAFCGPALALYGHFAIGNFVRDALFGKQITVQGDGTPMRSYLYGADLAVWLLHLLLKGKGGVSYNVGSDQALSIRELAFLVRDTLAPGKTVELMHQADSKSQMRHYYVPAITRARELGCQPWTSLQDAIALTGEYWLNNRSQ